MCKVHTIISYLIYNIMIYGTLIKIEKYKESILKIKMKKKLKCVLIFDFSFKQNLVGACFDININVEL